MSARIPPIGSLRDRVQLQRKDMSADLVGGHATSFTPLATVWARVKSLRGRERREADGRSTIVSHTVVMRYRADLNAGDQIAYRGRILEVLSAADLNGRRAYLSCSCAEKTVAG